MSSFEEEPKPGPPAYMVSFGDMMTLILTFFILLVSMAEEQRIGLTAKGIGSFVMALESHGLNGVLSKHRRQMIFNEVRTRFNLPPEEDPERREEHDHAADQELVRSEALDALVPHSELFQPSLAVFEDDSADLSQSARDYLDRLAPTLRPVAGQVLVVEGHADRAGPSWGEDHRRLALARAEAVATYLIEEHEYRAERVEARTWLRERAASGAGARSVDARLLTPKR